MTWLQLEIMKESAKKQLEHLYDQATFEVVLANLEDPKPKRYQIFVKHIKL